MKYLRYVALLALLALPLAYAQAEVRVGVESASAAMWQARRFALTAITRTIRTLAHPMATTVQAGSRTGSLSVLVPGTTVGDIHITDAITDAPTVAVLRTDMRDAGLRDMVLRDAVLRDVVLRDMVG